MIPAFNRDSFKQSLQQVINVHGVDSHTSTPDHILAELLTKLVEGYREANKAVHEFFGTKPPGTGTPGDGTRPLSALHETRPPGSLRATGLVAAAIGGGLVPAGSATATASAPVGAFPGDRIVDNDAATAKGTAAVLTTPAAPAYGTSSNPAPTKSYEHPTPGSGFGDATGRQTETPILTTTDPNAKPGVPVTPETHDGLPLERPLTEGDTANQSKGQATEAQRVIPGGEQLETDALPTGPGDYLFTGKVTIPPTDKAEGTEFDCDHTPMLISKKGDNSGWEAKYARIETPIQVDADHFAGKWQFVEEKVAETLPGAVPHQ